MMTNGIKRWLKPARSKAETPTQGGAFSRTGRPWRASPIAVLLGSAVICSSLAITTPWTTADAQGLKAGEGLRQARERRRRIPAAQRKAMKNAARAAAISRRLNKKTNTLDNQRGAAKSSKRAR